VVVPFLISLREKKSKWFIINGASEENGMVILTSKFQELFHYIWESVDILYHSKKGLFDWKGPLIGWGSSLEMETTFAIYVMIWAYELWNLMCLRVMYLRWTAPKLLPWLDNNEILCCSHSMFT